LNPSSFANTETVYLVIAAGGLGLRMGGGVPKQFRDWGGMPLLEATVGAFLGPEMPALAGICLAVPEDRLDQVRAWRFGPVLTAVIGGATRQESVALALAAMPDVPSAKVMIHDAVRPFPPAGPIRAALAALADWDGAVLGEPSTDTLKRVDRAGRILARLGLWREAFAWAQAHGFQGTDDVGLLEAMGRRVKLIPAPASNLKITTTEDWAHACPSGTATPG